MIAKMKKLTFLVYHKEYEAFLEGIRELGVVHVAEKQQSVVDNTELQDVIRLSSRLQSALKLLQGYGVAKEETTSVSTTRGLEVLEEIDVLQSEKAKLQQQLQNYQKDKTTLEPWGDFELESLTRLRDAGLAVNFYSCPESVYNEMWEKNYHAMVIGKEASRVFFIIITKNAEEIDLDAEQMKLPSYSLSRIQILCQETEQALADNNQKMIELAQKEQFSLRAALRDVNADMEFSKVLLNTESTTGEKLMLLQGWIPASEQMKIATWLDLQNVYYEITNPAPEDNVPIQLSNKGFFAWFDPICKLYMLPKYSELDLTPFFAPFFMVFFGLCLGDSGYGLFLFLGATFYRVFAKSISVTMKAILSLVQVLAVSTFFCGMLTGTFFGISLYDLNVPFLQVMKEHIFMDNNNMFRLSLLLGVIQILFGMVLKAVNQAIQFGFKYAVATIGWIVLLVSCGVGALLPAIMPLGGTLHLCILGVAVAMIFLYNSPGKNIFLNIGLGLWDSYNMATGLLGDVLSYVRLFALGLSGGILAGVFNSLAVGMSPDNVIMGPIVMVLIFVIGHAINIFMNVLGAMVHPMRLTFVEFFKNSGYEGGGKEYKPFKK